MKRSLKKVSVFLLLLIMGFGLIIRPSAVEEQDDDYFILELPSNYVDALSLMNYYNVREAAVVLFLVQTGFENSDGIIPNPMSYEREPLLKVEVDDNDNDDESDNKIRFTLPENVTEADLTIDVIDEAREYFIEKIGFDPFEGYSAGKVVLTEINDQFEISDNTLVLDLSNMSDIKSLNFLDFLIMQNLYTTDFEYYNINYYWGYRNLNNKTVVKLRVVNGHYVWAYGKNITAADNIEIDLPSDLKSSFGNKDKLALKFAEKSYDANTYVIDYTSINKLSSNNFEDVWDELYDYDCVEEAVGGTEAYSGNVLLSAIEKDNDGIFAYSIADIKDFVFEDNAIFDVSDDDFVQEVLDNISIPGIGNSPASISGVNRLEFIFKNLELTSDNDKIKTDFSTDDEVKFELDVDFDRFKDEVKVYVDEKELEINKDYTLSKGSIIVTLTDSFINTLEVGKEHTFTASVIGSTVTTPFTINAAEEDNDGASTVDGEKKTDTKAENPKTLDNIFVYLTGCIISVGGVYVSLKKLKNN